MDRQRPGLLSFSGKEHVCQLLLAKWPEPGQVRMHPRGIARQLSQVPLAISEK